MKQGTVKFFNETKGFGFITEEGSGEESETFRFLSVSAGSFDDKDTNVPTGVKGSRRANLAEMTEQGTSPFRNRGRILRGGTKRIQNALKTR